MKKIISLAACLILIITAVYSCDKDDNPSSPEIILPKWPKINDVEDVIVHLAKCYKYRNIAQYEVILHSDYMWYSKDGQQMDRDQDIQATANLFNTAEFLDLAILQALWESGDSVGGVHLPHFRTTREYYKHVKLIGDDKILCGHDLVMFIVVPVDNDENTRYKILAAFVL